MPSGSVDGSVNCEENSGSHESLDYGSIDVRSLSRFGRMFNVAANIVTRTEGAVRITLVVMLACRRDSPTITVYAVRVFRGLEAINAASILDSVYPSSSQQKQEQQQQREMSSLADSDSSSSSSSSSSVQQCLEETIVATWRKTFPLAKFMPRFPRVYFFFFDPDLYLAEFADISTQALADQRSRRLGDEEDEGSCEAERQPSFEDLAFVTLQNSKGRRPTATESGVTAAAEAAALSGDTYDDEFSDEKLSEAAASIDPSEALSMDSTNGTLRALFNGEKKYVDLFEAFDTAATIPGAPTESDAGLKVHCSTTAAASTTNLVDCNAYGEWLCENYRSGGGDKSDFDELRQFVEAYRSVDSVLFDRDIMLSVFRARPTLLRQSREWTVPLFRFFASRKINDILSASTSASSAYTGIDYYADNLLQGGDDVVDGNAAKNSYRVSMEECRSREGFNVVLPAEWIENRILPRKTFARFSSHVVQPNTLFTEISLLPIERGAINKSWRCLDANFWLSVTKLSRLRRGQAGSKAAIVDRKLMRKQQQCFADLFRLFRGGAGQEQSEPPSSPPVKRRRISSKPASINSLEDLFRVGHHTATTCTRGASGMYSEDYQRHYFVYRAAERDGGEDGDNGEDASPCCWGLFEDHATEDTDYGQRSIRFSSCYKRPPRRKPSKSTRLWKPAVKRAAAVTNAKVAAGGPMRRQQQKQPEKIRFDWEQAMLINFAFRFLDSEHSLTVNGDPGTGKSTVMEYLLRYFQRPMCAVPTNKMRHELEAKLKTKRALSHTTVITVSACVKRLGCFRLSPQTYSGVISKCFEDSVTRMDRILKRPTSRFNRNLFNVGMGFGLPKKPAVSKKGRAAAGATAFAAAAATTTEQQNEEAEEKMREHEEAMRQAFSKPPDVLMIDEANMNLWQHLAFISHAGKNLRFPLFFYGDSGQNRPIGSTADNSELIGLNSSLVVQMLSNKRLRDVSSKQQQQQQHQQQSQPSPLKRILTDNVWNINVPNDSQEIEVVIGNYIRSLIGDTFSPLGAVGRTEIDLTESIDQWLAGVRKLHSLYADRPCLRYARDQQSIDLIVANLPIVQNAIFLIGQANAICDRFNYWYAYAFYDRLCHEFEQNPDDDRVRHLYGFVYQRTAYVPRSCLAEIPPGHLTYDDPTFAPSSSSIGSSLDDNRFSNYYEDERQKQEDLRRTVYGTIVDDCWASVTVFCVGFVYMYLGTHPKLGPNSLLRLIQVMVNEQTSPNSVCHDPSCTSCIDIRNSEDAAYSTSTTRFAAASYRDRSIAGLLMQNLSDSRYFILTPEYYTVNRCSSYWCSFSSGVSSQREGSMFYGYAVRLYNSRTSYKVQGETLSEDMYPSVLLDLGNMERESTLVSLSRVRLTSQIKSIVNLDTCCRGGIRCG